MAEEEWKFLCSIHNAAYRQLLVAQLRARYGADPHGVQFRVRTDGVVQAQLGKGDTPPLFSVLHGYVIGFMDALVETNE